MKHSLVRTIGSALAATGLLLGTFTAGVAPASAMSLSEAEQALEDATEGLQTVYTNWRADHRDTTRALKRLAKADTKREKRRAQRRVNREFQQELEMEDRYAAAQERQKEAAEDLERVQKRSVR